MPTSREIVQDMMAQTYEEAPRKWPNGLRLEAFCPRQGENVYLVRTKAASTPVGFVGWQVRTEEGKRVGYYTVGFMPEHRGKGYAKEAVQKLINIKSAGVDVVRALIQKDNAPSLALAAKLGVDIVKVASNPITALDSAATKVKDTSDRVNQTIDAGNLALQKAFKGVSVAGFSALGGLTANSMANLALDDKQPGEEHYQRNRRLKLLATLLGAGAGGYYATKLATSLGSRIGSGLMRALKSDTAKTLGAGALGTGAGIWESNQLKDPGHLATTGLPLTNALMLMSLANPRMRKDFFGSSAWGGLNTKSLAQFLGGKAVANGAILAGDRGIGLLQNLGDAGKSVSHAAKSMEDSTSKITDKLNTKLPDIIDSAAGIAKGVESVTDTAAGKPGQENQSVSGIIRNLATASKSVADIADKGKATTDSLTATSGSVGTMADSIKQLAGSGKPMFQLSSDINKFIHSPTTRMGGAAALGGLAGYVGSRGILDDVPENHPKFNRNRRLRMLASLLGAGAGGAAAYATQS